MSADYTYRYIVLVGYQELKVEDVGGARLTAEEVLAQAKRDYTQVNFSIRPIEIIEESTFVDGIYYENEDDLNEHLGHLGRVHEYSLDLSSHRPPFIQLTAPNGVTYMIVAGTWGFENGVSDNANAKRHIILEIQNYLRNKLSLAY